MIDSVSCAGPDWPAADIGRFECIGVAAEAESASRIREEFAEWLQRFFDLDPIRSSDLVLAINEALANAAEFAYLSADSDRPKTMDLIARYDAGDARLITSEPPATAMTTAAAIARRARLIIHRCTIPAS